MNSSNIDFEIDGIGVSEEIVNKYDLRRSARNLRFSSKKNSDVIDFVGFEINNGNMLVSFPKHYIANNRLLGRSDVSLLFDVLMLDQVINSKNYIGPNQDFESNFPFESFFGIYQYFQKYGLYHETDSVTKEGYMGKVSWKDTIRKANSFIDGNSVIYLPLFVKETKDKQVFISECMAFAIDYTLNTFPMFIEGKGLRFKLSSFDFLVNKEEVVLRLRKIQGGHFKDIHRKLIMDLINFFIHVPKGGNLLIKHYNFELVWESIVEHYLNVYFVGIDHKGLIISNQAFRKYNKFRKGKFFVDEVHPSNRLEPDHYFRDGDDQYIFDAKYYSEIDSLEHKQIVYHAFLKNQVKNTFSALILPTSANKSFSKKHFELKDVYCSEENDKIVVWEYYLNVKFGMELFLKQ